MAEIRPYSFGQPALTPELAPLPELTGAAADLSARRFLVVDGAPSMRAATGAQLRDFGASHIDYANHAGDALGMIRRNEYDVILSEYDLGTGFDGLYLFEEARL